MMTIKKMLGAAAVIMGLVLIVTGTASSSVSASESDKVTICHAAGQDDTTHYITLTISEEAVYGHNGEAGHFEENGTPKAGHEQDYFGACQTPDTTQPVPNTTQPPVDSTQPPVVTSLPIVTDPPVVTNPSVITTDVIAPTTTLGVVAVGDPVFPADPAAPAAAPPALPKTGSNAAVWATLLGTIFLFSGIGVLKFAHRKQ